VAGPPAELILAHNLTRASLGFFTEAATAYAVRNSLGQVVRTGSTLAGPRTLAVEALPAGVYFLKLRMGTGRAAQRFVKKLS